MASITKRGDYQWQVQIRRKGQKLSKTFYFKKDAEIWARKTESEIDRGIFINTQEAERMTLSELIEKFENEVLPNMKAQSQEKSRLRIIKTELGKEIIGAITASMIIKYRNKRLIKIAANSVNREVTSIKRLLSFAHHDCKIILPYGVPQVRKLTVDDSRARRISDAEIEAICNSSDSHELEHIVKFALYNAMRRGEISKLQRSDINFDDLTAFVSNTKNGRNKVVPLMPESINLLKSITKRLDGFVFGLRDGAITKAFIRARDRARANYEEECKHKGVEPDPKFLVNLRLHDLRHEAITRLALEFNDANKLQMISGHEDLRMTSRYINLSPSDIANEAALKHRKKSIISSASS